MIQSILDTASNNLLKELEKDFDISFVPKNINHCELFKKNKVAIIYYNPKHINSPTIAHELLHIWLSKFNYNIGNYLYLSTKSDKKLKKIFKKFLCDYISNCCDHYKMYPKFIEMKYSDADFLKDSLEPKASLKDIKRLKLSSFGYYNSKAINIYIGSLISILADHVDNDYTLHHTYLKNIDNDLYSIILDFWNKWKKFDIYNIDAIYNSDLDLINSFIENMEEWTLNKKIV